MGKPPPVLVIVVAASIVLVAAVAAWYPQWAVAIVERTEQSDYLPGESVSFTLTLTVEGNRPVTAAPGCPIGSVSGPRSSCSVPLLDPRCGDVDYVVEDEDGTMIYGGVGRLLASCPPIMIRLLQPGDTFAWNSTWNQVNDSGFPVPAGHRYGIIGVFVERVERVHVLASPAWVFVKPA